MENSTVTMPLKDFYILKEKADRIDRLEGLGKLSLKIPDHLVIPYHNNMFKIEVSIHDLEEKFK